MYLCITAPLIVACNSDLQKAYEIVGGTSMNLIKIKFGQLNAARLLSPPLISLVCLNIEIRFQNSNLKLKDGRNT